MTNESDFQRVAAALGRALERALENGRVLPANVRSLSLAMMEELSPLTTEVAEPHSIASLLSELARIGRIADEKADEAVREAMRSSFPRE